MADYWDQLLDRVKNLRDIYAKKIQMKPNEGLTIALDEAEASAKGIHTSAAPTDENFLKSVNACHTVWNLWDVVNACADAGLDVTNHLRQLTTGTIDYGVPADAATSHKTIYFRDFESELFVAAQLGKARLPVHFFDQSNDPRGEMYVDEVFLVVKHPNAAKRIERLMGEFNGELQKAGKYWVFVAALEDAFRLADQSSFASKEEFSAWERQKRAEMEASRWKRSAGTSCFARRRCPESQQSCKPPPPWRPWETRPNSPATATRSCSTTGNTRRT